MIDAPYVALRLWSNGFTEGTSSVETTGYGSWVFFFHNIKKGGKKTWHLVGGFFFQKSMIGFPPGNGLFLNGVLLHTLGINPLPCSSLPKLNESFAYSIIYSIYTSNIDIHRKKHTQLNLPCNMYTNIYIYRIIYNIYIYIQLLYIHMHTYKTPPINWSFNQRTRIFKVHPRRFQFCLLLVACLKRQKTHPFSTEGELFGVVCAEEIHIYGTVCQNKIKI